MKNGGLQTLLLGLLAVSTSVIALQYVRSGEMAGHQPRTQTIEDWNGIQTPSSVVEEGSGVITIVEFSDFQCPFCARVQETLRSFIAEHPGEVRLLYRHLPLPIHTEAVAAAEAAECANEQDAFAPYHNLLFVKQDSIGIKSWRSFAIDAGVRDTMEFERCLSGRRYSERVEADVADAKKHGFDGTPMFVINGKVLRGAVPLAEFHRAAN